MGSMEEVLVALSLTGMEEMAWHVDLEGAREGETNLSVVGSFLNASAVQFQAMHTTLANLWHPYRGLQLIDVRKPLIRRKKLLLGNKGYTYVRFQYEKLLVFCFLCGRLGHSDDIENVDPNRAVGEEDCLIEIGKGKKCQRSSQFSSVFSDMDLGKTTDGHPCVHESDISASSTRQGNWIQ
ncbi:hypothetical protein Gogos_004578 [Gossypium gossypioides]|uniref:Zinc knuckle CX2CX4HX4C domain-containing protein n=1 Tax=Gossypium gossypioides TaxID=34282 RepID=A0A7J9CGN7_GOSGO|nr:hypothetical protein [Gossypium gossypioides]